MTETKKKAKRTRRPRARTAPQQKQKQQQTVNIRIAGGVMPRERPKTAPEFSQALAISAMMRPPPVIQAYDPGLAGSVQQNREAIQDLSREIARLGGLSIMGTGAAPTFTTAPPTMTQTGAPINITMPAPPPPAPPISVSQTAPISIGIPTTEQLQETRGKLKKTPARVPAQPTVTPITKLFDELRAKVPEVPASPMLSIMGSPAPSIGGVSDMPELGDSPAPSLGILTPPTVSPVVSDEAGPSQARDIDQLLDEPGATPKKGTFIRLSQEIPSSKSRVKVGSKEYTRLVDNGWINEDGTPTQKSIDKWRSGKN